MLKPLFFSTYKVYINHTDAGGIVYHANYLTFFENCRRDWLESLGFDGYFFLDDNQNNIHFVVSQANVFYKFPLFVDDKLIVTISQITAKSASLVIHQEIYRSAEDFNQARAASHAVITLACVRHDALAMKPCRLPQNLQRLLTNSH